MTFHFPPADDPRESVLLYLYLASHFSDLPAQFEVQTAFHFSDIWENYQVFPFT